MKEYITKCCGCEACMNSCPIDDCITIRQDENGNFYKDINTKKCIKCGKCQNVCPMEIVCKRSAPRKAYAVANKDLAIAKKCSSAGVAATIYQYCIENNISCVGVRYTSKLDVVYDFITIKKDIDKFVGSKYVHSHMGMIYKQIDEKLRKNEKVVFIGLPCHVAALKNYIKRETCNLVCIDLVCHGVVHENILKEHMQGYDIEYKDIASINFREKNNQFGITTRNSQNVLLKSRSREEDEYMMGYCEGFTYNESCYQCSYANPKRCGDITLKDFGGKRSKAFQMYRYGMSGVMINTAKGFHFWKQIRDMFKVEDYSVKQLIAEDARLQCPMPYSWKRRVYKFLYKKMGFDKSIRILCFTKMWKGKIRLGK